MESPACQDQHNTLFIYIRWCLDQFLRTSTNSHSQFKSHSPWGLTWGAHRQSQICWSTFFYSWKQHFPHFLLAMHHVLLILASDYKHWALRPIPVMAYDKVLWSFYLNYIEVQFSLLYNFGSFMEFWIIIIRDSDLWLEFWKEFRILKKKKKIRLFIPYLMRWKLRILGNPFMFIFNIFFIEQTTPNGP